MIEYAALDREWTVEDDYAFIEVVAFHSVSGPTPRIPPSLYDLAIQKALRTFFSGRRTKELFRPLELPEELVETLRLRALTASRLARSVLMACRSVRQYLEVNLYLKLKPNSRDIDIQPYLMWDTNATRSHTLFSDEYINVFGEDEYRCYRVEGWNRVGPLRPYVDARPKAMYRAYEVATCVYAFNTHMRLDDTERRYYLAKLVKLIGPDFNPFASIS